MDNPKIKQTDGYWYLENGKFYFSKTKPNFNHAILYFYSDANLLYYEIIIYDKTNKQINDMNIIFKRCNHSKDEMSKIVKNNIYKILKNLTPNYVNDNTFFKKPPRIINE